MKKVLSNNEIQHASEESSKSINSDNYNNVYKKVLSEVNIFLEKTKQEINRETEQTL